MASPKLIEATVAFTDPANNVLASGAITFDLSQPAIVSSGGGIVPERVTIPLNTSGTISGSPVIWANDQISPSGTTYRMRVYNSNGLLVADWGQVILQGASPIDLALLTPVSSGTPPVSVTNIALVVASADIANRGSAITTTTLYAIPNGQAGIYRISWAASIYTPGSSSSTLGGSNGFQVLYTDFDTGDVVTTPTPGAPSAGVDVAYSQTNEANTTSGGHASGVICVQASSGTNLQYAMDYTSSGATVMTYNLHIRVEYLQI